MSDFEVHPVGTADQLRRQNGSSWSTSGYRHEGTVGDWAPDFAGWNYRVQLQRSGAPWTITGGCVLCLIWPEEKPGTPVSARLAYLPPAWLESA